MWRCGRNRIYFAAASMLDASLCDLCLSGKRKKLTFFFCSSCLCWLRSRWRKCTKSQMASFLLRILHIRVEAIGIISPTQAAMTTARPTRAITTLRRISLRTTRAAITTARPTRAITKTGHRRRLVPRSPATGTISPRIQVEEEQDAPRIRAIIKAPTRVDEERGVLTRAEIGCRQRIAHRIPVITARPTRAIGTVKYTSRRRTSNSYSSGRRTRRPRSTLYSSWAPYTIKPSRTPSSQRPRARSYSSALAAARRPRN